MNCLQSFDYKSQRNASAVMLYKLLSLIQVIKQTSCAGGSGVECCSQPSYNRLVVCSCLCVAYLRTKSQSAQNWITTKIYWEDGQWQSRYMHWLPTAAMEANGHLPVGVGEMPACSLRPLVLLIQVD